MYWGGAIGGQASGICVHWGIFFIGYRFREISKTLAAWADRYESAGVLSAPAARHSSSHRAFPWGILRRTFAGYALATLPDRLLWLLRCWAWLGVDHRTP